MRNYSRRLSDDATRGRQDGIKCEKVQDKKGKKWSFAKQQNKNPYQGEDLNQMISEP